jgi:hypothetical protein
MKQASFFCALLGVTIAASCAANRPKSEPIWVPASGVTDDAESVPKRVAATRCDHELLCQQVGPEAPYATLPDCMKIELRQAQEELSGCALASREKLRECLEVIMDAECTATNVRLERFPACAANVLCKR